MVIDDRTAGRVTLCEKLNALGLEVMAAGRHGIAAHELANEIRPDIAFIAVEEPLVRTMLTVDFIRDICPGGTVVAYSTQTSPEFVRRMMQADVADILAAPVKERDLEAAVNRALAAHRRSVAAEAEGRYAAGMVLAVVGQKGGIGKTTLSTNLAATLAAGGHGSVLLVDLDTRFGDVAVMMDLEVEFTAANAARSINEMDRETFRAMLQRHSSGAYVLPAPASPKDWVAVEPSDLESLVEYAASLFDYVILDTPGTLDEGVAAAIEAASQVVVVTSADLSSVKNTNLLMAYMEGRGIERERAVITLTHNIRGQDVSAGAVEHLLETEIDFEIPFAPEIIRGSQLGQPIVMMRPNSRAAHTYREFAALLTGLPVERPEPEPSNGGLLSRLGFAIHGRLPTGAR